MALHIHCSSRHARVFSIQVSCSFACVTWCGSFARKRTATTTCTHIVLRYPPFQWHHIHDEVLSSVFCSCRPRRGLLLQKLPFLDGRKQRLASLPRRYGEALETRRQRPSIAIFLLGYSCRRRCHHLRELLWRYKCDSVYLHLLHWL